MNEEKQVYDSLIPQAPTTADMLEETINAGVDVEIDTIMDIENKTLVSVTDSESTMLETPSYTAWCERVYDLFQTMIKCTSINGTKGLYGQCGGENAWYVSNGPLFMMTDRFLRKIPVVEADIDFYKQEIAHLEKIQYRTVSTKEVRAIRKQYKEAKEQYTQEMGLKRLQITAETKQNMLKTDLFDYQFTGMNNTYTFSVIYLQDIMDLLGLENAHFFLGCYTHTASGEEVPVVRVRGEHCTIWLFGRTKSKRVESGGV